MKRTIFNKIIIIKQALKIKKKNQMKIICLQLCGQVINLKKVDWEMILNLRLIHSIMKQIMINKNLKMGIWAITCEIKCRKSKFKMKIFQNQILNLKIQKNKLLFKQKI